MILKCFNRNKGRFLKIDPRAYMLAKNKNVWWKFRQQMFCCLDAKASYGCIDLSKSHFVEF